MTRLRRYLTPAGPEGKPSPRRRSRRACILRQNNWYEPMVQREAEALAGAGFDVQVLCMRDSGDPPREVINDVTVIRLPASRRKSSKSGRVLDYAWFFLCAAGILSGQHIRRPYSVVQANSMPDFLVFAALVPKVLGSRVVAYLQEPAPELAATLFGPNWLTRALASIEQRAISFADHTVTVTAELKERYVTRGARADRITVVLNCADPEIVLAGWSPPQAPRGTGFVVVCHGTIEDRYGQDTIIDAARLLRDEIPDLRVVITGRGSATAETMMMRAIADHGLQQTVRFEGWVGQARLNDILSSADVGVVAQKASPYSHLVHTNKMVDYWIFGLPVIASRLRAVSALYGDDVLEYFQPGDAASLAAAIRRLHGDPRRREELVRNGGLAQQKNGWTAQRITYLGVFDSILGDVAAHPPSRSTTPGPGRELTGPH